MLKHIKTIVVLLALAVTTGAHANNISVANVGITNQNVANQSIAVKLDLAWENSWRISTGPANWDAAWVFVKFHTGDGVWRHASLSTNNPDHTVPANVAAEVGLTGTKGVGVFIHRSVDGSGTNNWQNINLKWMYGLDGVSNTALVTVDVSAIEMVYVPQGSFYVGDGSGNDLVLANGTNGTPYQITSAGSINVSRTNGYLWTGINYASSSYFLQGVFTIPASFPKGYNAFYCMKYETSQGQIADFCNKSPLSGSPDSPGSGQRQFFSGSVPNYIAATPDRAYNDSSGQLFLRYLDWTGLRPMTQFEYEKACRGTVYPVPGEFAWGTAVPASLIYTLTNNGTASEAVSVNYNENAGNAWYGANSSINPTAGTNYGPARVGMFAKASYNGTTSGRIQSGSTYYGIMDMTGNVGENVVRVPAAPGDNTLGFLDQTGDGLLSSGSANIGNWNNVDYRGVGGDFYYSLTTGNGMGISRLTPSLGALGIRGVRPAP